ncbi:MAG TPA: monovalent cation/H+ antiporter complex subunit F [Mariniphaga sp.]|nr:monovalent cation/H+ antiporter complex subunit F [Mariniphaga sp.]
MMDENTTTVILIVTFAMLLAALVMAFIRLMRGPTVNDRIAAMDLIAIIVMAFILVYSILINNSIYFDIPIIISLISFIGTVAVSTYLKHRYD